MIKFYIELLCILPVSQARKHDNHRLKRKGKDMRKKDQNPYQAGYPQQNGYPQGSYPGGAAYPGYPAQQGYQNQNEYQNPQGYPQATG